MYQSSKLKKICEKCFQIKSFDQEFIYKIIEKIDPFRKKKILIGSGIAERVSDCDFISNRKNLSNNFKTLKKINSVEKLYKTLENKKIPYPEWSLSLPKKKSDWLFKDTRSVGGNLVKKLDEDFKKKFIKKNTFFQKIIEGRNISVQFFSNNYKFSIYSVCSQWFSKTEKIPFLLEGIVTIKDPKELIEKIRPIIEKIVRATNLNGLNSIDFIIHNNDYDNIKVIDINARPGLSINFLSKIYKEKLFSKNTSYIETDFYYSTAIVYCNKKKIFDSKKIKRFNKILTSKSFSELPNRNILVSKSEPLCLVHAKSKSLKRVKSKIKKLSEIIIKI